MAPVIHVFFCDRSDKINQKISHFNSCQLCSHYDTLFSSCFVGKIHLHYHLIVWIFKISFFFFFDLTLNTHSVLNRLACVQLHSHLNKGNCCVLNTKNFHKSARSEYSYLSIFLRNNWIFKDLIVSLGKSWTPLVFFSLKKMVSDKNKARQILKKLQLCLV